MATTKFADKPALPNMPMTPPTSALPPVLMELSLTLLLTDASKSVPWCPTTLEIPTPKSVFTTALLDNMLMNRLDYA